MLESKKLKKPENEITKNTQNSHNINSQNLQNLNELENSQISEEKIKVLVRIKPNPTNEPDPLHISENKHIQIQTNIFEVDRVYKDINQQQMFENTGQEMAQSALYGINCCLFTYGQTNSGKTYTMIGGSDFLGKEKEKKNCLNSANNFNANCQNDFLNNNNNLNFKLSSAGILPRTLKYFFDEIDSNENTQFDLECSFFEIYNEKLQDLLDKNIAKDIRICGKKKKGKINKKLIFFLNFYSLIRLRRN